MAPSTKSRPKKRILPLKIQAQPDEVTCGPTSLQAVYRFWGRDFSVPALAKEVTMLAEGGTLAVFLGLHALAQGFKATLYSYNLKMFDPTWFAPPRADLAFKLREQLKYKKSPKMRLASEGYLAFLAMGGRILMEDLRPALLRRFLDRGIPVLTGLSSTALYQSPREVPETGRYNDVAGEPAGHFVVLYGYDRTLRQVMVADPYSHSGKGHHYAADIHRVLNAILLGTVTYDGNFLILEPHD